MDASWDPACFRLRLPRHHRGHVLLPEVRVRRCHHHSRLRDRRRDARMVSWGWADGWGRPMEQRDRRLTGFSAASTAALAPASMLLTFSGTRRHVRSGPRAVSGPKAVIGSWTCCLRRTSPVRSLRCAYPDPAPSLLLTGVTALFHPQAGLRCLRPAGQPVRVTQGRLDARGCVLWASGSCSPARSPSSRPPHRVLSIYAIGCGAAREEAPIGPSRNFLCFPQPTLWFSAVSSYIWAHPFLSPLQTRRRGRRKGGPGCGQGVSSSTPHPALAPGRCGVDRVGQSPSRSPWPCAPRSVGRVCARVCTYL